nr:hypothetical protein MtrunA17_Chr3g0117451 [Ipomoea batatas]
MNIRTEGLTSASPIGPLSPCSTRLSVTALKSGGPPFKLSKVQRGMPKSTGSNGNFSILVGVTSTIKPGPRGLISSRPSE